MRHPRPTALTAVRTLLALILLTLPALAQSDPPSAWEAGQTNDGRRQFARISQPPHRLTYICQRGGPDMLMVEGLAGRPETLHLSIDDQPIPLKFAAHGPRRNAPAQLGSPLVRALFTGKTVALSDDSGSVSFPLEGAERAMRNAMNRCLRRR